ncbi:N-acetylneuraminate lyase [Mycoplasmopsis agassizii]|uniref:N-acetylneuraminate lyase n=1 Tax=Mycoplasmopsis agassizii TaxID=33922 RepID=A0ABX4H454_9BACT|nr:N-acetylneuraminate lyase [Mycoplasmopsis agassizii]PAF54653.1 N-acetylneuraminate lyase [Mycoplasmopsis agassizii]SMC16149.1 N-acetylneuraminate lyase [Mycoplasmopsis agassizii]
MKNKKYSGLFAAMITPFDEKGKVKFDAIPSIVKYMIEVQKLDGLYVTGSTGEFLLISVEDRKKIFDIVAKEAKGKITLIAQVGTLNFDEILDMAHHAKKAGFDAISAISPYYFGFSFDEIKNYYQSISDNVDIDLFPYYLPQYAGGKMSASQFSQILKIKNVVGVKYSAGDPFMFERLINSDPDKVYFWGSDEVLIYGAVIGADGYIGSTYNANGLGARRILEAYEARDFVRARELIHEYNDYVEDVVGNGLMTTLKALLRLDGLDAGISKHPFAKKDDEALLKRAREIKSKYLDKK